MDIDAKRDQGKGGRHPCFDKGAAATDGRIHLPVAPRCNLQCIYCNRREDCVNESRPGVTSKVMSPEEALAHLRTVLAVEPRISVVAIAGPGDPLANPEATFRTLEMVREEFPHMLTCLSTNGLGLTTENVERIRSLGVGHVTVTVNAVDPRIGGRIYARVREERVWFGEKGAELLLERQKAGVRALADAGIVVKINTVVIPGMNEDHVGDIAREMASLGAKLHNCLAVVPAKGTPIARIAQPSIQEMNRVRAIAAEHLEQMRHCARCRADAIGLLGQDRSLEFAPAYMKEDALTWEGMHRPHVAVATMEGVLVNQHLGVADHVQIWAQEDDGYRQVDDRPCPSAGTEGRWDELGRILSDCRAILVAAAGESPRRALESRGILALEMEGVIDDCLEKVFRGTEINEYLEKRLDVGKQCGCGKVREKVSGEGGC